MKNTIVITGPTASGKSGVAMKLAQGLRGTIINDDSLQLYAELPILTALPSKEDMHAIPHKLYAILKSHEEFSIAKWLELATAEIRQAEQPIVVGGTAFYIKALQEGLSKIPPIDNAVRAQVRELSSTQAHQMLAQKDPQAAVKLHFNDTQRVSRALEVIISTGKSIIEWQNYNDTSLIEGINCQLMILLPDLATLHANAERRLHFMFDNGAIEEVRNLTGDLSPTLSKAIGLREIQRYLTGEISKETALDLTIIATKQYIKRQRTWFHNQFPKAQIFGSGDELLKQLL